VPNKAGDERRRLMLDHIRRIGRVEVTDLADRLQISLETVRRDLAVLEHHGLISRSHGGAFPTEGARYETSLGLRARHRVPDKRRIAAAAVQHIDDAATIFVDEGFTAELVAEQLLALDRPLTVITASLGVTKIVALAEGMSVIQLGGRVRERTMGTVDHWAVNMISDMVIDLAILGANGIAIDRGLTTPDPAVQALKQRVVQVSRRRLFVGISTKFGVKSFCRFADITDFEKLITDTGLSTYEAGRFSALGPEVKRV
jgi:DeoR family fructose operon transcriptional repressor